MQVSRFNPRVRRHRPALAHFLGDIRGFVAEVYFAGTGRGGLGTLEPLVELPGVG